MTNIDQTIPADDARSLARQAAAQLRAEWEPVAQRKAEALDASLNYPDFPNRDDVIDVCQLGWLDDLKILVAAGADITDNDNHALCRAAENGKTETVRFLLDQGADIHARNDCPLQWAASGGWTETVRLLLDRGADLHAQHDHTLAWTADEGHMDTMHLLIQRGAPLEKLNLEKRALYEAYAAEQTVLTQRLTDIFKTATWAGHIPEMLQLWQEIPDPLKEVFDFQTVLAQTRHQALRQSKPKITLVR
jgi:ankyrin repeat protein